MGPKSGWGGPGIGYVRPVQFLDHLTVIKMAFVIFINRHELRSSLKDLATLWRLVKLVKGFGPQTLSDI